MFFQRENLRFGVALGKGKDVLHGGAAPGIDALEVVAHRHQIAMARGNNIHKVRLQSVGVLIFIHQHMLHALLVIGGDIGVLAQQAQPVDEQIVKIHGIQLALALRIALGNFQDARNIHLMPREVILHCVRQLNAAIGGQTNHGIQHPRLGEFFILEAQIRDTMLQQTQGVVFIQNAVIVAIAQQGRISPQHAVGRVMERAAPHAPHPAAHQLRGAVEHLAGGAIGERQQQNPARVHLSFQHQPSHAAGQRLGFARARRRNHQRRTIRRRDRAQLLRVELLGGLKEHGITASPATQPPRPGPPRSRRRSPDPARSRFLTAWI